MRLGIFGGTFDPIHYGHLRLAEEARDQFALDRVLFVPNWVSPFKVDRVMTPGAVRAEMVRVAIQDNPAFNLDTIELDRPGPSYSVETLRSLRKHWPDAEFFFLTGADAVRDLAKWREPEELLSLAHFIASMRVGVSRQEISAALPSSWRTRISFLDMPMLDISSTNLRERVQSQRSIRYLTPPGVVDLIRASRLYRTVDTAIAV